MFFRDFLARAVDAGDEVTRAFVETMIPALIVHYGDTSAKGGDHARDDMYDEQTKRKFEEKDDQSMLSHQLNGIFPALRLLNILEKEDLVTVPYSDIERQVYILSYLMHDVNKILNIRDLEECGADAFFPGWRSYLEDIAYLVVNTQEQWGTHLNTYAWNLQLPEKRI